MERRGAAGGFLCSGSRKSPESSGVREEFGFSVGIMPCRGMPQTTQASAFNEISAPQQVQYAAKDQLQNFTPLECAASVKDSFSQHQNNLDQVESIDFPAYGLPGSEAFLCSRT